MKSSASVFFLLFFIATCGSLSFRQPGKGLLRIYRIGTYDEDSLFRGVPYLRKLQEQWPEYSRHLHDSLLVLDSIWYEKYISFQRDSTGWNDSTRKIKKQELFSAQNKLEELKQDTGELSLRCKHFSMFDLQDQLIMADTSMEHKYNLNVLTFNSSYKYYTGIHLPRKTIHYFVTEDMIELLNSCKRSCPPSTFQ